MIEPKASLRERTDEAKVIAATESCWPETGCRQPYEDGFTEGALSGPPIEFAIEALKEIEDAHPGSFVTDESYDALRAIAHEALSEIRKARG